MKIQLNGQEHTLSDTTTVGALLEHLEIRETFVAVEVNGVALPFHEREGHLLSEGDVVEVVRFVGGG